jgi:regulator of sigma E protease
MGKDLTKVDGSLTVENIQSAIVASNGNPITLSYKRGQRDTTIQITPNTDLIPSTYTIGVTMNDAVTFRLPFLTSILEASRYSIVVIRETVIGLALFVASIFHGTAHLSDISGPVKIAIYTGDALQLGFSSLVMFVALISINLGVINLIPFPALDGGRALFVLVEGIIRRRIPEKFSNTLNFIGFVLLMILMIILTYREAVPIILKLVK